MNKIKEFSESAISLYSHLNRIDIDKACLLFKDIMRYYNGSKNKRLTSNPMLNLEKKWYESLNSGIIDYSVYSDDYYFIDLMACYWIYSKGYIDSLNKKVFESKTKTIIEKYPNISSVMDLGCGLGYTTNDLAKLFSNSKIYCSNIKYTPQWSHCVEVLNDNIILIDENSFVSKHIDLVFASEFFEHIEQPIEYLNKIIETNTPNIFIIANSFNTKSIGHFHKYKVMEEFIDQKDISRIFNATLKHHGYSKEKTSIWNDKPSIWVKNES